MFKLHPSCRPGLGWLLASALSVSSAMAQAVPPALQADQLRSLPQGHWLVQDAGHVRLLTPSGHTAGQLALRSEGLDVRMAGQTGVAVVTHRDTRAVVPIAIDLQRATLTALPALDTGSLTPESACLHRDAQGLLHAVVLGQEGQAQQWVLHEGQARLLRHLALAPGAERCQIDDHTATLFLLEPQVGLWAYGVTPDAPMTRALVARSQPQGRLPDDTEALVAWPGGVAVLNDTGRQVLPWTQHQGTWRAQPALPLGRVADGLAVTLAQNTQLWWRDAQAGTWSSRRLMAPVSPAARAPLPYVLASAQTEAVASKGDAADDPAIWVNPQQPQASRILGTNKKQGLEVYDLAGRLVQQLPVGRVNNVDVRQGVRLGEADWDIAVASNRSDNTITVWSIDTQGTLTERARIPTGLDEVYGLCLYKPASGGLHAVVNDKDGRVRQFALLAQSPAFTGRLLREFALGSQPEGCVVDDRAARVFLGEEDRGVWSVSANPHHAAKPRLVAKVGRHLKADVEGLGLYHGARHSYLVVSSQGDHSIALFSAQPPYRHVGSVRVGINMAQGIDAVSETDGLEVTSASLGGNMAQGMLVVQDGYKRLPDGTQNFKLIPWREVTRALKLPE